MRNPTIRPVFTLLLAQFLACSAALAQPRLLIHYADLIYKMTQVDGALSTERITGAKMDELLNSIQQVIDKARPEEMVFINMPKASPREAEEWTTDELDEVSPEHPIALLYNDSVVVVNHAMLDRAFAAGWTRKCLA